MRLKKDPKKHLRRFEKQEILDAFKMLGNEYRMNVLLALKRYPNITLEQINDHVGGDFKNIHVHVKKLSIAGLVNKKYKGNHVQHTLSEYGKVAVDCFHRFEKDPY